ncbi:MAG: DUF2177 family protein [Rhizobiaceae bacterium]
MKPLIAVYCVGLAIFLALDALWLGVIARNFYASRMGSLMLEQPRWGVAALFYLLFVVGLVYFAISAHVATGDWRAAALNGALFGFFCYLTYDATNLAVLKGYDTTVAVVDTLWGTLLGGVVSALTVVAADAFGWAR